MNGRLTYSSKILVLVLMSWTASLTSSCGPNSYKSLEKKEPAEDATIALENNDAQKAIDILTSALSDDPTNQKYISILAMAYAQRAGVDPITLAMNMSNTSALAESNNVTSLFSVMPVATEDTIADVDKAVELLISIPTADRKTYDTLKLAMFQTAAMTLRAKILDTNGDGILSTEELLAMSSKSAIAMITQIAAAAGAFTGVDTSSATDKAAAEQITKIQAAIASEPGATDEAKLKSYLAKSK